MPNTPSPLLLPSLLVHPKLHREEAQNHHRSAPHHILGHWLSLPTTPKPGMTELLGMLQGLQGPTLRQGLGQLRGVCWNVRRSRGYASCWSTMWLFWSSLKSLSGACCSLSLLKLVCSVLLDLLRESPCQWLYMFWAPSASPGCIFLTGSSQTKHQTLSVKRAMSNQQSVTENHMKTFHIAVSACSALSVCLHCPCQCLSWSCLVSECWSLSYHTQGPSFGRFVSEHAMSLSQCCVCTGANTHM